MRRNVVVQWFTSIEKVVILSIEAVEIHKYVISHVYFAPISPRHLLVVYLARARGKD
jgi:hypothetical protein